MSTRGLLLLLVAAGLAAGCGADREGDQRTDDQTAVGDRTDTGDPTNTGVNERDRNEAYPVPTDQPANEQDMQMVQNIRKMLMDDESLSMMAKNVKIVAASGKVTLRGPVQNEAERTAVAAHAQHVAGAGNVDNMLEIDTGH